MGMATTAAAGGLAPCACSRCLTKRLQLAGAPPADARVTAQAVATDKEQMFVCGQQGSRS
jgi:hypothetical protein